MGVPVALIIPFDGTYSHAASANVARVLNIYKSAEAKVTRGPGFHGELTNYYVQDANVGHMNIDKYSQIAFDGDQQDKRNARLAIGGIGVAKGIGIPKPPG